MNELNTTGIFPNMPASDLLAVGAIDGGVFCDVLAMQWLEGEKAVGRIRIRFEQFGDKHVYELSDDGTFDKAMWQIRSAVEKVRKGEGIKAKIGKPLILRGEKAQAWLKALEDTAMEARAVIDAGEGDIVLAQVDLFEGV